MPVMSRDREHDNATVIGRVDGIFLTGVNGVYILLGVHEVAESQLGIIRQDKRWGD